MAPTDSSPVVAQPPNSLDHHVVALRLAHEALVRKYLRKGDTLTHTRCMGCLEEHVFVEYAQANGRTWLRGTPTKDTIRLGGSREPADDIAFYNVTHINRVPVDVCEFAVEFAARGAGPSS